MPVLQASSQLDRQLLVVGVDRENAVGDHPLRRPRFVVVQPALPLQPAGAHGGIGRGRLDAAGAQEGRRRLPAGLERQHEPQGRHVPRDHVLGRPFGVERERLKRLARRPAVRGAGREKIGDNVVWQGVLRRFRTPRQEVAHPRAPGVGRDGSWVGSSPPAGIVLTIADLTCGPGGSPRETRERCPVRPGHHRLRGDVATGAAA